MKFLSIFFRETGGKVIRIREIRLFSFSGEDDKKDDGDSQQGAEDIDVDHSVHKFAGLSSLFVHNSQKKDDNDRQSSENVDGCHNIVDIIHKIYSLIRDTLEYQARNEKSKPNKAEEKFIDPDTIGPMNIAAKIT